MHWNKRNGRFPKDGVGEVGAAASDRTDLRKSVVLGADLWTRRWVL